MPYCVLYGPPQEVAAARDPAEPPGGWFLKSVEPVQVPAEVSWLPHQIGPCQDFSGGPHLELVNRFGETEGVTVEAFQADVVVRGCSRRIFRLHLSAQGWREQALDLSLFGTVGVDVNLYGDANRLVIWSGEDAMSRSLTVHDRRTGARVGDPVRVEAVPYNEICLAGDDGIILETVLRDSPPAFALSFDGNQGEALLFEQPDRPGRTVRVRLPSSYVPYEAWIVFFRQHGAVLEAEIRR
jgi:hypothetical protein